jgi:putative membrane protein
MIQKSAGAHWLRNLLCGILIGAGAILPGVSGGVLAVVFGIYRPMMEMLTHPLATLPKYWKWLPPLGIGWAIGFWVFAKGIALALNYSASVTTWLFIGLIVGSFPQLFREAGREGHPRSAWISLMLCGAGMFAGLFYISRVAGIHVEPNFWWYGFCGVLWGAGTVIPGMTTASILMALDLYQPLMDGLSGMQFSILLSALPGMLLTIASLAHAVSWLFRKHYPQAFHGILGIVAASTLVIVPTVYRGAAEIVLALICGVGGFALAFLLGKLDRMEK